MVASYKRKKKIEFKQRSSHGCVRFFFKIIFIDQYYQKRQKANDIAINFKLGKLARIKPTNFSLRLARSQNIVFSAYFLTYSDQSMADKFLMMLAPLLRQETQKLK